MSLMRKTLMALMIAMAASFGGLGAAAAQPDAGPSQKVLHSWYSLILALVRHTPTFTPPVASRALAYAGVTAFEAVASGSDTLQSLAGQLNDLKALPQREAGKTYNDAVVLHAAMASTTQNFFNNTGPTGQRAIQALEAKLRAEISVDVSAEVVARSDAYGKAIAAQVLAWSQNDGGAVIENMGFPAAYTLTAGPAHWVPTSLIALQQSPLLPNWGKNRTFAMPKGTACELPAPVAYSEDKSSEFYKQAVEVFETKKNLTPEQRATARYWSDDAMLSLTPPGHWISIAMQVLERDKADLTRSVDVLARLGLAEADAFIGCWQSKFQYDTLRPVTYIRRLMDPAWESTMVTPPFPEYPSGHSVQSGAAATVLTKLFGDNVAFEDATLTSDGFKPRAFSSFWAAANEAGISRLYGGIHFRAAIDRGLDQGRCIGAFVNALRTRR